jgi:HTH-type transcriptional regulator/antitoxin HipB
VDYPVRTASELQLMLKAFRKAAGLTQAGVAGLLGVTQQTYAALEVNPGAASMERLLRVLRALNVQMTFSRSASGRPNATRARSPRNTVGAPQPATRAPKSGPKSAPKSAPNAKATSNARHLASSKRAGKKATRAPTAATASSKKGRSVKSAPTPPRRVVRKREDW